MEQKVAQVVRSIYVSNIPWTVGTKELKNYFSKFGAVIGANIVFDKNTGLSRGYGFVRFDNQQSYRSALEAMNHYLDGKKINVSDNKE